MANNQLHPIDRYLAEKRMTQAELSALSGVPQARICDVRKGRARRLSPEYAQQIVDATGGALTLQELLLTRPVTATERKATHRKRARTRKARALETARATRANT